LSTSPPLTVYLRQHTAESATLHAHGDLDVDTIGVLATALDQAVATCPLVVCDLNRVTFFGAAGANAIAAAQRRAVARGHRLELTGAHGITREVLMIAGLGTMLRVPG
jgi:anti-anti-sigma factor